MPRKLNANDKIHLEYCADGGTNCRGMRAEMNYGFQMAENLVEDKQYDRAFRFIIEAFRSTYGIKGKSCHLCIGFFRKTIYDFAKTVSDELAKMTSGLFKQRQLIPSYKLSLKILEEMESVPEHEPENGANKDTLG